MPRIRHGGTGREWPLLSTSIIGRGKEAWINLDNPSVSAPHASLSWLDGRWILRDLGSRNGTILGGSAIGLIHPAVAVDQKILVGGEELLLVDLGPPEPIISSLAEPHEFHEGEDGILALETTASVLNVSREAGRWCVNGVPRTEETDEVVHFDGRTWRVHLPTNHIGTVEVAPRYSRLIVRHDSSFEYFELALRTPAGREFSLGKRSYAFMLFVLADQIRRDAQDRLGPGALGWMEVEDLLDELTEDEGADIGRPQINLYVLRFRRLMERFGVSEEEGPRIERRGDTIRLAGPIDIEALS